MAACIQIEISFSASRHAGRGAARRKGGRGGSRPLRLAFGYFCGESGATDYSLSVFLVSCSNWMRKKTSRWMEKFKPQRKMISSHYRCLSHSISNIEYRAKASAAHVDVHPLQVQVVLEVVGAGHHVARPVFHHVSFCAFCNRQNKIFREISDNLKSADFTLWTNITLFLTLSPSTCMLWSLLWSKRTLQASALFSIAQHKNIVY